MASYNRRAIERPHVRCANSRKWVATEGENVVLIADIGGTNCRFELWNINLQDRTKHRELFHITYPTREFPTFPEALQALARQPAFEAHTPRAAAFGVAGPVADNRCEMTNLSWVIDGDYLTTAHGVRMAVLNDFEANGYGVTAVSEENLVVLNDVPAKQKGPKAVLGPGTGLGQAQVLWDEGLGGYRVWPSEGSHATFAPRGWKQRALQAFVERELGACEVEHVACGSGLERIYSFLATDEPSNRPKIDLSVCLDAPMITRGALDGTDTLAGEAVDMFLAIIGAEAGYMGLRALATGGVYLCGGITPKLITRIKDRRCLVDSFLHKESRFHRMVADIPLYAVVDNEVGLLGVREISVTFYDEKDKSEKTVRAVLGQSLMEAAHANDVDLEGACEGSLACSTCHVVVEDADLYNMLPEPTDDENDMLDLAYGLTETSRLGCQVIAAKELDGIRVRIPGATRNFAVDGHVPKPH
ncbi:hypothetical protein WJX81_006046 [Elliptochloris bilobata]|uniref:2Fe-2S ferredoxin-type domain-containing protein n=1 Tax=Elliptochloris bilobata TaxID=381761 RepID=A0AAW1SCE7_9CHLO